MFQVVCELKIEMVGRKIFLFSKLVKKKFLHVDDREIIMAKQRISWKCLKILGSGGQN